MLVCQPVSRHKYTDFIVKLSVEIYIRSHCGFRKTVDLLSFMNNLLGWDLPELPTRNTIENWVLKSGYSIYQDPKLLCEKQTSDYAQIIDESMMLGSEKLVLSLGVKADKEREIPLTHNDVEVLDMSVSSRWNSQGIKEVLNKTESKMGKPPLYIIADNDSKLHKAIVESDSIHIRDIGHTLALLVERQYKNNAAFKSYTGSLGRVKIREVMRETSYLLPPRQRSIARFMNLSARVAWSIKMLRVLPNLNAQEQEAFGFLKKYEKLIKELQQVFDYVDFAQQVIKCQGISRKSIEECLQEIDKRLTRNDKKITIFKQSVREYFLAELAKIADNVVWHASSDVIESLFGSYKLKKSANSLCGVTNFVLMIPLLTKTGKGAMASNVNFKQSLEKVFMRDLSIWKQDNLTENLAVKRKIRMAV